MFKIIRVVDEVVECIINLFIERLGNKLYKKVSNFFLFMYCFLIFILGGGVVIKLDIWYWLFSIYWYMSCKKKESNNYVKEIEMKLNEKL